MFSEYNNKTILCFRKGLFQTVEKVVLPQAECQNCRVRRFSTNRKKHKVFIALIPECLSKTFGDCLLFNSRNLLCASKVQLLFTLLICSVHFRCTFSFLNKSRMAFVERGTTERTLSISNRNAINE